MTWLNTWYLIRSAGIVAYLLISLSVLTGLYAQIRKKQKKKPGVYPFFHDSLGYWGLYLTVLHITLLLFDKYQPFTIIEVLVPFASSYKSTAVAMGIIGFYFLAITILTTKYRAKIGIKVWRKLHMLTPLLYVFVTVHGILSGTDSEKKGMFLMYTTSLLLFVLLLLIRFKKPAFVTSNRTAN